MKNRSVLLMATNQKVYLDFALNCAESIKLHNPDLPVFIVTNIKRKRGHNNIKFITISEEIAMLKIEAKLYINNFLQTEETLFVDSDCICFGDLSPLFNACQDREVTVVGTAVPVENIWGDSSGFARAEFGIDSAILFNGGLYYLKKSAQTNKIYNNARQISSKYDEYGFARNKEGNWKNDETIMALALAANKQQPVTDNGLFITDMATDLRPKTLNVLKGKRLLRNSRNRPDARYPASFSPILLHFGGANINSYPYISQRLLIQVNKSGLPVAISSMLISFFVHFPYRSYHLLRSFFSNLKNSNA